MFADVNSAEVIQTSYCQYIHGACSDLPVLCPSFATESLKQVFPTTHSNNSVGKQKYAIISQQKVSLFGHFTALNC